jgi:hypothetical protein
VIDEGLTEPWPREVIEAAERFQQGDLIEAPPIAYAASLRYPIWSLTRDEATDQTQADGTPVHLALTHEDRPPFGIITSQTCDVAEDRPQPLQPWIEIAPVYRCHDDSPLLARDYVYPLDSWEAPERQRWIADLRLKSSLEKSVLVGREPIDPFATETERIAFGVALGRRSARAALADAIHEFIDKTMSGHNRKPGKRVGTRVYKLMLQIAEGERLNPRAVRLHVLHRDSPDATEEEMRTWFDSWWDKARTVADERGVNLLATHFHRAANMNIELYDALVEIRCPLHSRSA